MAVAEDMDRTDRARMAPLVSRAAARKTKPKKPPSDSPPLVKTDKYGNTYTLDPEYQASRASPLPLYRPPPPPPVAAAPPAAPAMRDTRYLGQPPAAPPMRDAAWGGPPPPPPPGGAAALAGGPPMPPARPVTTGWGGAAPAQAAAPGAGGAGGLNWLAVLRSLFGTNPQGTVPPTWGPPPSDVWSRGFPPQGFM